VNSKGHSPAESTPSPNSKASVECKLAAKTFTAGPRCGTGAGTDGD
jgi:hypothetical protein